MYGNIETLRLYKEPTADQGAEAIRLLREILQSHTSDGMTRDCYVYPCDQCKKIQQLLAKVRA